LLHTGADPGFQVRGAHLKKLRRAEGGAKIVGVFRVKNHDFTPQNHVFQLPREARKFLRYFVWKITILRQKIIFFSNFRGGARRVRPPPPLNPPLAYIDYLWFIFDIRNTRVEIQYYLFPVIELIWMFGPIKLAFCYISVCTKPGKWGLCICVSGISILSLSIYILLDFGDVSTVWYFSPSY
jgi:hypothetical protein